MANNKPEGKRKKKISFSINEKLLDKMDDFLTEIDVPKRSKYIEKLIREDMEKRGRNIDREF